MITDVVQHEFAISQPAVSQHLRVLREHGRPIRYSYTERDQPLSAYQTVFALPYADGTFHRVLSTLMYHHLRGAQKEQMLREVRRVLTPGGTLHLLDFAGPGSERRGFIASHLHSHRALRDNDQERVLASMRAAGFAAARVTLRVPSLAGDLLIYEAAVPDADV